MGPPPRTGAKTGAPISRSARSGVHGRPRGTGVPPAPPVAPPLPAWHSAHEAGKALITEGQYDWAVEKGIHQLVPVPRHIANVQMIGIARLRYRPHTRMTAAWWADLNANAQRHLARYLELSGKNARLAV